MAIQRQYYQLFVYKQAVGLTKASVARAKYFHQIEKISFFHKKPWPTQRAACARAHLPTSISLSHI